MRTVCFVIFVRNVAVHQPEGAPKLAVMDVFKNGCVQKLGQPCNEIIADMFKFDIDVLVSVTCSVFSIFATHF